MATTNLEGNVFRLSGLTLGSGGTIPTGTTLDKVVLTTRDLDQGGTEGLSLDAGEAANLLINGTLIATVVPQMRATLLVTDAGSFTVLVFSVGGNSYALAPFNTNFAAITHTTAPATLNIGAVTGISPIQYGLQPEDSNTYTNQVFTTSSFGSQPPTTGLSTVHLLDTDLVRGNGATAAQEIITNDVGSNVTRDISSQAGAAYSESLTTLQFSDGTVLGGVETLQSIANQAFGFSFGSYFFDKGALAASGHTIADVAAVLSSVAFDHNLSWAQAGFTFQSGPVVNGGGDNVPPPPPLPTITIINGTSRADVLTGTSGSDAIRGFDGNDRLTGGTGRDAFVFGTDSRSGVRSTDRIPDYQAGLDVIALESGSSVKSIIDNGSAIVITLVGDNDRIVIDGAALNLSDIIIQETSGSFSIFY